MAEDRQILFDYWESIPSFEEIKVPKDKYYSHPIRRKIIRLLKDGIQEKSPDGKFNVRHALNVKEISFKLKESDKRAPTKTTLYFHLDTLSELGLIKVVATLHEGPHGRNKTKYFGRVARNLFVSSQEYMVESYKAQYNEFQKLAEILGFKLPTDYPELPERISETHIKFHKLFGKWLIKHEKVINEEHLDMNLLYQFLVSVYFIHPDYVNLLNEIFHLLQDNI
ncbi:MAG: hypothetical protein ACFE8U_17525 [Candidatus Hermodarchaeota archaeon]